MALIDGRKFVAILGIWCMWEVVNCWTLQVFLVEVLNRGIIRRRLASALVASEYSQVDSVGGWTSVMATDSVCSLMRCTMGLIHVIGC